MRSAECGIESSPWHNVQKPARKQGRYAQSSVTLSVVDACEQNDNSLQSSLHQLEHIALAHARAFARQVGAIV